MGFWRTMCCIPKRKRTKSEDIDTVVRIKEDESFDNVVPESSIDSQAIEGPFSKKSQFEDILNSKQNELVFEEVGESGDRQINTTITIMRSDSDSSISEANLNIAHIPAMNSSSDFSSYTSVETEEVSEHLDPNDTKASIRPMLSRSMDELSNRTGEIHEAADCKTHDARYSLDPVSIGHMRMNIAKKLQSPSEKNQDYQGDELKNLLTAKIEELEEGEVSDDSEEDPIYEPGSTQSDDSFTISDEDGYDPRRENESDGNVSVQEMLDLHGEDLESLRRRLSVLNRDVTSFQDEFIERRRREAEELAKEEKQEEPEEGEAPEEIPEEEEEKIPEAS
ncbi:Oidioi.mRNA.OKI2018_I69.PAR.g8927.t1.cds [Oikopleura dioica]|uniref:Oidioi.mRNA.OKI2018_I69.PAR.g8927.t1.cds n=1 Tax=Oikopleura dioica TaxID=34765 RepID=A0ABN7RNM8_OIKDI|nr:Oidioi.mRNA.OKI2018_I69.PAR.g8927.t1.cds [Oikopleura dioica]